MHTFVTKVQNGKPYPDFRLPDVEGGEISLSEVIQSGNHALLVFLRHLGWLPCREHAAQLCQRQDDFTRLNTRVLIVSFGTLPALQQWMRDTCVTFDVLIDSDRSIYQAYQLESSRWRVWTPRTIWTYAKLLMAGRKLQPKDGDTSQLGGDFIIDSQGKIQLAYRSQNPADRPPVDDLLEILEKL